MKRRKTAGELSAQAKADSSKYNARDIGLELTKDVPQHLEETIRIHNDLFDEDQYCVVMILAKDSLLDNVMRRKFYGWLFMPKPRPSQTVFFYDRKKHHVSRLWTLPDAITMATIAELKDVRKEWRNIKTWVDEFYVGWKFDPINRQMINTKPTHFFNFIRRESGVTLLSEKEYLDANREKLIHSGGQNQEPCFAEPFDFSKIIGKQIVDSDDSFL
jgi:hypothetical protein